MSECSGTGKMRTIALHDSCVTLNPLEVSKEYTNRELLRQIPDNVIKIPVPKQRNCRNQTYWKSLNSVTFKGVYLRNVGHIYHGDLLL